MKRFEDLKFTEREFDDAKRMKCVDTGFLFLGRPIAIKTDSDRIFHEFQKWLHEKCKTQHPPTPNPFEGFRIESISVSD